MLFGFGCDEGFLSDCWIVEVFGWLGWGKWVGRIANRYDKIEIDFALSMLIVNVDEVFGVFVLIWIGVLVWVGLDMAIHAGWIKFY